MVRETDRTVTMRLIERDHGRASIEQIMIEAYRQQGSEEGAAALLGISQQTFNKWKYRLGIADLIAEIARLQQLERGAGG
ncbi:MAG: hypothetical protein U0670_24855 [Anaerolineae bacterium]